MHVCNADWMPMQHADAGNIDPKDLGGNKLGHLRVNNYMTTWLMEGSAQGHMDEASIITGLHR